MLKLTESQSHAWLDLATSFEKKGFYVISNEMFKLHETIDHYAYAAMAKILLEHCAKINQAARR